MRIFSLYFPLILSFLSFLHSIVNSINKHIHSFIGFATGNIATDEHKLHLKPHRPISASATTDIHEFMSSTESLGLDSIDDRQVNDHDHIDHDIRRDDDNDNDDDEDDDDYCYDSRTMRVAEGRQVCYPPLLSSLNRNGRRSFYLRPVRKNGRLILTKVRMKSHEMIYSSRENGRLRLYLVPDDDDEEEVVGGEVAEQKEEEMMVDSGLEEEENDEEIREEIEEDSVGEWNYGMGSNEGFRRCHQMMNPCYQNQHMYGLGIA